MLNDNKLISINEDEEAKVINENNEKKPKKEFKFPWWFKIFAYILSFTFAFVSLFFVVIKGIEFGEEKVTKWLTSIIVSFLCSTL